MINQPEAQDLLSEARAVLLDSLVPHLSGDHRYEALMIANAMGMAVREFEASQAGQPEAVDRRLDAFLESRGLGQGEDDLARAIRERRLTGGDGELRSVLRSMTEARLRINNPGYLK